MSNTVVLKMYTNGYDYVIAEDLSTAKQIMCHEKYGLDNNYHDLNKKFKKELDGEGWREQDENSSFTLYDELGGGMTRTVRDWIKKEGKGFFACSEY